MDFANSYGWEIPTDVTKMKTLLSQLPVINSDYVSNVQGNIPLAVTSTSNAVKAPTPAGYTFVNISNIFDSTTIADATSGATVAQTSLYASLHLLSNTDPNLLKAASGIAQMHDTLSAIDQTTAQAKFGNQLSYSIFGVQEPAFNITDQGFRNALTALNNTDLSDPSKLTGDDLTNIQNLADYLNSNYGSENGDLAVAAYNYENSLTLNTQYEGFLGAFNNNDAENLFPPTLQDALNSANSNTTFANLVNNGLNVPNEIGGLVNSIYVDANNLLTDISNNDSQDYVSDLAAYKESLKDYHSNISDSLSEFVSQIQLLTPTLKALNQSKVLSLIAPKMQKAYEQALNLAAEMAAGKLKGES